MHKDLGLFENVRSSLSLSMIIRRYYGHDVRRIFAHHQSGSAVGKGTSFTSSTRVIITILCKCVVTSHTTVLNVRYVCTCVQHVILITTWPRIIPLMAHRPFCLVTNRNVILAEHIADFDLELISSTITKYYIALHSGHAKAVLFDRYSVLESRV